MFQGRSFNRRSVFSLTEACIDLRDVAIGYNGIYTIGHFGDIVLKFCVCCQLSSQ